MNTLENPTENGPISLPEVVQRTVLSSKTLSTRLSAEEMEEVEDAAKREGRTRAEWMREVLLRAARQQAAPPFELLLEELVATQDVLFNSLIESARCSAANGSMHPEAVLEMIKLANRQKRQNALQMVEERRVQSATGKAAR
jgi:hypothetical protein